MKYIYYILKKLKLTAYLNFCIKTKIGNASFNIPVFGGLGEKNINGTEPWMLHVIERLLNIKGGCFIDIGANIGQTLLKLKSVSKDCRYIGFEPNPICINYLEQLIRINNFKETVVVPTGIGNKTELLELNFYEDSLEDSSASLKINFRPDNKIYFKKNVLVSDYSIIEKIIPQHISIVKIDVEGFEEQVIKGIDEILKEKRPFVLLEILPVYNESASLRLQSQLYIENYFLMLNYKIVRVLKTDKGDFESFYPVTTIGIHSDLDLCEYLIIPEEVLTKTIL